jgi:hypothetical protein
VPRLGDTVFTPRLVLSATPHGRARVVPAAPVGPRDRPHVTRERLGRALIGLTVGAFVLAHPAAYWGDEPGPGATAAFLTVAAAQGAVVGALLGLSHRHRRTAPWAAVMGALAAAALAWWYGFGAAVPAEAGSAVAAAAALAAATLGARVVRGASTSAAVTRVLAADYPLVGLVWLATPALWLAASDAAGAAGAGATACVALFGASVIVSVRASRGSAARGGDAATVAGAGAWALTGATPLAAREPVLAAAIVGLVMTGAWAMARWSGPPNPDRRFEQEALLRASPALVAAALLTLGADAARDERTLAAQFVAVPAVDGALGAYAALAVVAGYAGAEWRGRRQERPSRAWRRLSPDARLLVVSAELARAVLGGAPNLWHALAALAAARLGAALYHSYREHVQALRAAGRDGRAVYTPVR